MSIHIDDLRDIANNKGIGVCDLAADEIEELEAENHRLENWHSAVLAECTSIGACYQESDPEKTVRDLIDWHRKDAVWHHDQEAAGRVAASPPVPDIANGMKFVIDWLEGGKDPLLAAKELRSLVAASPAPENQSRKLDADVAAQNYCRSMWGAARGYPDWRRYHDAFVAGYMAKPAPPVQATPDTKEFRQFLSDVMTAAGLVEHGKQCKALAQRLSKGCMQLLSAAPAPPSPPTEFDWAEGMLNEMLRRCELRKHNDDYLCSTDTQLGVEFAIEYMKKYMQALLPGWVTEPAPPAEMAEKPIYQINQNEFYGVWGDTSQADYESWLGKKRILYPSGQPAVQKADAAPVGELFTDGWMQAGSLLYRLTNDRRPQNCDEINVTMADGSRADDVRAAKAIYLLNLLGSAQAPALTDSERLDAKSYRYLRKIACNMQFDESELHKAFSAAGYSEEPPTEAQFDSVIRGIVADKDAS